MDRELAAGFERAMVRADLTSMDVASVLRFRVRAGFFPPEAEGWLGDSMLLKELARALALRFDNPTMPTAAVLLDLMHAPRPEDRIGLAEVLGAGPCCHPAAVDAPHDARPLPRAELAALGLPEGDAVGLDRWRALHAAPAEAFRSLWADFVGPFELWRGDAPELPVRGSILRPDASLDDVARVAWKTGLHLRHVQRLQGGARLLKGWNAAPRGFLVFDWLGAGPLGPGMAEVKAVRVDAEEAEGDAIWSALREADLLAAARPFVVRPANAEAQVRALNELAFLVGSDPSVIPEVEREVVIGLSEVDPAVAAAAAWAATFLPTPYGAEVRAGLLGLARGAAAVPAGVAETALRREVGASA